MTTVAEAAAWVNHVLTTRQHQAVFDTGVNCLVRYQAELRHTYFKLMNEGVVKLHYLYRLGGVLYAGHVVSAVRTQIIGNNMRHVLLILTGKGMFVSFSNAGNPDYRFSSIFSNGFGCLLF